MCKRLSQRRLLKYQCDFLEREQNGALLLIMNNTTTASISAFAILDGIALFRTSAGTSAVHQQYFCGERNLGNGQFTGREYL